MTATMLKCEGTSPVITPQRLARIAVYQRHYAPLVQRFADVWDYDAPEDVPDHLRDRYDEYEREGERARLAALAELEGAEPAEPSSRVGTCSRCGTLRDAGEECLICSAKTCRVCGVSDETVWYGKCREHRRTVAAVYGKVRCERHGQAMATLRGECRSCAAVRRERERRRRLKSRGGAA